MSARLSNQLRACDVAGRYGGEEWIVLLPQNTTDGADVMAERWRAGVEAAELELADGRTAVVTISIGIAGFEATFETPAELVAAADSAPYLAKQKGHNHVETFRA